MLHLPELISVMAEGYSDVRLDTVLTSENPQDVRNPQGAPDQPCVTEINVTTLRINTDHATVLPRYSQNSEGYRGSAVPNSAGLPPTRRQTGQPTLPIRPPDGQQLPPSSRQTRMNAAEGRRRAPAPTRRQTEQPTLPIRPPDGQLLPPSSRRTRMNAAEGRRRAPALSPYYPSEPVHEVFKSRCCFSFLACIFGVVIALVILAITSFVIKDSEVNNQCDANCSLTCDYQHISSYRGCGLVYAGALVCVIAVLFIVSLLTRICYGVKV